MSIGDLIDMSSPADSIASQSGSTEPLDIRTGNVDCPSCDPNLRVLTHGIPMSHHVNSTLVCRISGEVMDSENEPLAFPNGNVYSSKVSPSLRRGIKADAAGPPGNGQAFVRSRHLPSNQGELRILQVEKGLHLITLSSYCTSLGITLYIVHHSQSCSPAKTIMLKLISPSARSMYFSFTILATSWESALVMCHGMILHTSRREVQDPRSNGPPRPPSISTTRFSLPSSVVSREKGEGRTLLHSQLR